MSRRAFTLIELLVVISIIGLLSSIVLASLNAAREKAKTVRAAQDFRQIEIALNAVYHDYGCWPRESNPSPAPCQVMPGAGTSETQIATYVAQSSGLGKYLKQAPAFPFPHDGNNYLYDNDGDSHNTVTCASDASQAYTGPGIFVRAGSNSILDAYRALNTLLDKDVDPNSNTAVRCGKIRLSGSDTLFYGLSNTQ